MRKILLIFCFLFIIPFFSPQKSAAFIDGVTIQGQNVGGLTASQVKEKLEPYVREILEQKIILVEPDGQKIRITSYKRMGVKLDLDRAIKEGLKVGNERFFIKRWWMILQAKRDSYNIPLHMSIDKVAAAKEISRLTKSMVRQPQNAQLVVLPNNEIKIKPDVSGQEVKIDMIISDLEQNLNLQGPLSIRVLVEEINASIREQDLRDLKIETLLGQFTTWFNSQKENRTLNIRIAAQVLDNFILAPEQEFSFNKIVGPRTKEAGYNEAPIILNNKFAEGVGGGVCQVSSTLYNVLLRTNLTVTERHPHSLLVHYVPKGLDAAVVYGLKDLKFINNTSGHILIKTYVGQGSLTIKLFGCKKDDTEIELLSIIEEIIPPKIIIKPKSGLPTGLTTVEQEGARGYVVRVERIIRDSKQTVLVHEILTRDYYPPIDKIIVVNANDNP